MKYACDRYTRLANVARLGDANRYAVPWWKVGKPRDSGNELLEKRPSVEALRVRSH